MNGNLRNRVRAFPLTEAGSSIECISGEDAVVLLEDSKFVESWRRLSREVSGFNTLVSPDFIIPWYHFRKDSHEPIIIFGCDSSGQLVGIFPLARRTADQHIVIAGDNDAEYHSWIATASIEVDFVRQALMIIQQLNPQSTWEWHYLPVGRSTEALTRLNIPGIHIDLEPHETGLWDLSDEARIMHHSRTKSSAGRYRKQLEALGETRLEYIQDSQRLSKVLEIARKYKDFRHEAFYGHRLFDGNPGLVQFCLDMQDNGIAHNIALWQNDKLIAFSNYITDGTIAYAGLPSYEPSLVKFKIGHMMILNHAKAMIEMGMEFIDLTPGNDEYKSSYATEYRDLYKPTIYFSNGAYRKGKIKKRIISKAKDGLELIGSNPKKVRYKIEQLRNSVVQMNTLRKHTGLFNTVKSAFLEKIVHTCFDGAFLESSGKDISPDWRIEINVHESLRLYSDYRPHKDISSLLQWAWFRYNRKERIITIVSGVRLLCYASISNGNRDTVGYGFQEGFPKVKNGLVCHDIYFNSSLDETTKHQCLRAIKSYLDLSPDMILHFVLDQRYIDCKDEKSFSNMPQIGKITH